MSLPPYTAPFKPVPQVTPFTYRDGVTMLKKIENLQRYINRVLIPFVNDSMTELGDDFETQVNALITAVNAAIELVINDSIEVQDPVVAALVADDDSQTQTALDARYGLKSALDAIQALIDTGRLSEAALNNSYAAKSIQEIVETGRLSVAALDAKYGLKADVDQALIDIERIDDKVTDSASAITKITEEGYVARVGGGLPKSASDQFMTGIPGVSPGSAIIKAFDTNQYFSTFVVNEEIKLEHVALEITTGPVGAAQIAVGVYNADNAWQPVDRVAWQNIAVTAGQTGAIFSPLDSAGVLKPGRYITRIQCSAAMSLRCIQGGMTYVLANRTGLAGMYTKVNAFEATPPPNGAKWDTAIDGSGLLSPASFRWTNSVKPRASHYLLPDGQLVKGVNLTVNHMSWGRFWGDLWDWEDWVKPQIDAAHSIGANTIRSIGSMIHTYPGQDGYYAGSTFAVYRSRWRQIIDYCKSLGMYVYACGGGIGLDDVPGVTGEMAIASIVELAKEINGDPTVFAFDINQENYYWVATWGASASAQVRAVCDKPITYSQVAGQPGQGTGFEATYAQGVIRDWLDFYDYHAYYDFVPSDVDIFYANNSKPLLIGEFGSPESLGSSAYVSRATAVRNLAARVTTDGKHCAGMLEWAATDQDPVPSGQWGLFTNTWQARPLRVEQFAQIPTYR